MSGQNLSEQNINEVSEIVSENSNAVETAPQNSNDNTCKKHLNSILDYVEIFVIGLCVVLTLFMFTFRICTVDGDSMNKTLSNGEKLVISNLFYTPERGDVVVFHQTGKSNMPLVKRVIGVEGDTVVIDFNSWTVKITNKDGNTTVLDEPYINIDKLFHLQSGVHRYEVPEGTVFVLGDNRNDSMDSTDMINVGYVDCRRILGKVIFRYSPFSEFGFIE